MGCFGSKDKLSKEDMDFLKTHTRYDETTIKEWYKGFKVIKEDMNQMKVKMLSLVLKPPPFLHIKSIRRRKNLYFT